MKKDLYVLYCKWVALPKELREPKGINLFKKRYDLHEKDIEDFKNKKSFYNKRLFYFWDFMKQTFPDVLQAMDKRHPGFLEKICKTK